MRFEVCGVTVALWRPLGFTIGELAMILEACVLPRADMHCSHVSLGSCWGLVKHHGNVVLMRGHSCALLHITSWACRLSCGKCCQAPVALSSDFGG